MVFITHESYLIAKTKCITRHESMLRSVEYSRAAAKTLTRIDRATSRRIRAKIDQLAADPDSLASNVKKLKGSDNLFRLRIGDWRVIYTEEGLILLVLKVSPRASAYE